MPSCTVPAVAVTLIGTMYELRNKLDRRNVSSDTKKNYRACNSFLQDVLDGYLVACAMHHFKMKSADDDGIIPVGFARNELDSWFKSELMDIVDRLILNWEILQKDIVAFLREHIGNPSYPQRETVSVFDQQPSFVMEAHPPDQQDNRSPFHALHSHHSSVPATSNIYRHNVIAFLHRVQLLQQQQQQQQQQLLSPPIFHQPINHSVQQVYLSTTNSADPITTFPCRVSRCGQAFIADNERRAHERSVHGLSRVPLRQGQMRQGSRQQQSLTEDCVFNYSSNIMTMALLERDFHDAVREMDGPRLLRLWKIKMLYFKAAGRTKYALEALLFQADQLALLSPWDAYRQLWNRGFNLSGGSGKNIPLDMMVEHNNLFIKEMIGYQGANVTFKSAQQVSRASIQLEAVLGNLDKSLNIHEESGGNAPVDKRRDILLIADEVRGNIIKEIRPRAYKAFPEIKRNVFQQLDSSKVFQWIQNHKKLIAKVHELESVSAI